MKSEPSIGEFHGHGRMVLASFCLWLAVLPAVCAATTYYVDANHPSARDTNPGTEALPFKTINKATGLVNPGDTVFVKAGIYRETVILSRSGTQTKPITVAARPGHEGKVIINAAEPVTNWRKCTGPQDCAGNPNWTHLYWADVTLPVVSHPDKSFAVGQVFQQGKLLPRSRFPDTGWRYPTSMPDPMTIFADSGLSQPAGYFNGAVCHIKTADWQINQILILGSFGPTIILSQSPRYAITTRYGYYITSIVGEINAEGEWAYNPEQRRVFLWPQGDLPDDVEFSYRQYCIRSSSNTAWNIVRGLTLRHAYMFGLWLFQSNDMTIEDNAVEYTYGPGIFLQAANGVCDRNQILHNTIRHSASRGIQTDARAASANIEGNYVYATGTDTFGGDLRSGQSFAIYVSGPSTRVYNNRIDKSGYTSIYLDGPTLSREVSYNYVTNISLSLTDAGGIYTTGLSGVPEKDRIHHNILVDAIGCRSMDRKFDNGRPLALNTHSGGAVGIYVDQRGNNRVIEDNTVINSRMAGIFFHGASGNLVQRNTLYGNQPTQLWLAGKIEPGMALLDDTVLDNILFATDSGQKTLYLALEYDNLQFGRSDRNHFYNPYNNRHIFVSRYPASGGVRQEDLSLAGWQALCGYDLQSREFSYLEQFPDLSLARPQTSRIVYNATLDVATVDLEGKKYCDVQGNEVSGSVTLQPFESKILIALGEPTPESEEQTME